MPHRRSLLVRSAVVLSVAAALLGACSDKKKDDSSSSATTTTSASTTTTAASGGTTTTAGSGSGGSSTSTSAPPAGDNGPTEGVIELTIKGGDVEGGVRRETVKQGSTVTLRVTSDVADELHVHGYDLKTDLVAGQSTDLTFLAKIPGVFEVELEHRGKKVLELEVRP
jgi:hypothetical protein